MSAYRQFRVRVLQQEADNYFQIRLTFNRKINYIRSFWQLINGATLRSSIATLRSSIATLRSSIATLRSSIATLRSSIATLLYRVRVLQH